MALFNKCCSNIWLDQIINGGGDGPPVVNPLPFILTFDDIINAPVADPYNVADWNTLLAPDIPFDSVQVVGGQVSLYGYDGTSLGIEGPFFGNAGLININDSGNIIIGVFNGGAGTGFFSATGVQSVTMNGLLNSGTYTFAYCYSLTSVTMNACTVLGSNSFLETTALTSVSFPNVVTVESQAFYTAGLVDADFPALTTIKIRGFASSPLTGTLNFPLVNYIYDACFQSCQFTTIALPSLVLVDSSAGGGQFSFNTSLLTLSFPLCTVWGASTCRGCTSLTTLYLPLAANFGSTVGDNLVFLDVAGQTIVVTVPVSRQTCDAGNPDGDLVYLLANNPLSTIVYV